MEATVVPISIKSGRPRKRFPKVGEMVRVDGRKGLLTVRRVDREQGVADLVQRMARNDEVMEQNVPFHLIRNVPKGAFRAIQEFLQS